MSKTLPRKKLKEPDELLKQKLYRKRKKEDLDKALKDELKDKNE